MPNGLINMEMRDNRRWVAEIEVGFPQCRREVVSSEDFDDAWQQAKDAYHRMSGIGDQTPPAPVAPEPPKADPAPVVAVAPKPAPAPAPKPTVAAPAAPAQPAAPLAEPAPADASPAA